MNATDFIISKLKSISSKIPGIGIKYAYDRPTDFHIVEISPESIRLNDEEYGNGVYAMERISKFIPGRRFIGHRCKKNE